MGGCFSGQAPTQRSLEKEARPRPSSPMREQLVLKLLVEVNTLSSDEGPLQWQLYFPSLVPLSLHCLEGNSNSLHRVSAIGVDGTRFESLIRDPETRLRKTSDCFVQWRDSNKGTAWGLNFMSEDDALEFMKACLPTSQDAEMRHALSTLSLSLPIPNPPTGALKDDDPLSKRQQNLDSVICEHQDLSTDKHSLQVGRGNDSLLSPDTVSPAPGGDSSYELGNETGISDIDAAEFDEDTPELFEPSSPFDMSGNFILEDIAEEAELDESLSEIRAGPLIAPAPAEGTSSSEVKQGWIEYAETSFSVQELSSDEVELKPGMQTSPGSPPSLPVSPPPGPTLSPRLSILISDRKPPSPDSTLQGTSSSILSGLTLQNEGRFSVISLIDDVAPPLPSSLPPGKLISPRHSILNPTVSYDESGNMILSYTSGIEGLDIEQLSKQINDIVKEREQELKYGDPDEQGLQSDDSSSGVPLTASQTITKDTQDQVEINAKECGSVQNEQIPPPLATEGPESDSDDEAIVYADENSPRKTRKLNTAPSFLLRTFDPPAQYSDSGFPDSERESGPALTTCHQPRGRSLSEPPEPMNHRSEPLRLLPPKDGVSDERLTEYTESIGMKTNASSGSMLSDTSLSYIDEQSSVISRDSRDKVLPTGRDGMASPLATHSSTQPAMRKAGWLEMKTVLVCKNRKVAMASKRKWKRHWVTLKGCHLLLHLGVCDGSHPLSETTAVDGKLDLEKSLAHSVHDHVKRDHIFCLSTSNGNTYYMQTTNQTDVEDWITAIHCAAANAFTHHVDKDDAVRALKKSIRELSEMIEKENQLKNLTELNLSALTDPTARAMAAKQVTTCTENIEKHNVNLYRTRCYIASLQGTELPNPQSLMSSVSKPTKLSLSKVGMFSVASLHAIVSARHSSPSSAGTLNPLRSWRTKHSPGTSAKGRAVSSQTKTSKRSLRSLEISYPIPLSPPPPSSVDFDTTDADDSCIEDFHTSPLWPQGLTNLTPVRMPSGAIVHIAIRNDMSVSDVLHLSCEKHQLNVYDHFLRLKIERGDGELECEIPQEREILSTFNYSQVEICQKWVHTVILEAEDRTGFGFSFRADQEGRDSRLGSLQVSGVMEGGAADKKGVKEDDEILLVNDASVIELGWEKLEAMMKAQVVTLTLRSCRLERPLPRIDSSRIVESLICPAPPKNPEVSSGVLQNLIIPMPSVEDLTRIDDLGEDEPDYSGDMTEVLLKDTHALSKLVNVWKVQQSWDDQVEWTKEDKLRKTAQDLIETERDYVRLLELLNERYLTPLQQEKLIPTEEANLLRGQIPAVIIMQREFLNSLEEAFTTESESDSKTFVKSLVVGISGAFTHYADHFRMYITFCMSYQKGKEIIANYGGPDLDQFLAARNPQQDSSLKLDALLAKPIVRISRYPLYLSAMMDYTQPNSEERMLLQDALSNMMRVADYTNEMKRVSDIYSSLFDAMLRESNHSELGVNVNISQLLHRDKVLWLNVKEEQIANKGWKKGQGPQLQCFVFKTAIVLLYVEQKRRGSKPTVEETVAAEDVRYKTLLPCVQCTVHDLPDSDGVTNMWQLLYHQHKSSPVKYILRGQSSKQKSTMVQLLQQSIMEQQEIYRKPLAINSHYSPLQYHYGPSPTLPLPHSHILRTHSASQASAYMSTCTDSDYD